MSPSGHGDHRYGVNGTVARTEPEPRAVRMRSDRRSPKRLLQAAAAVKRRPTPEIQLRVCRAHVIEQELRKGYAPGFDAAKDRR